jgi:putative pyruvate formate lyase activating enzyme
VINPVSLSTFIPAYLKLPHAELLRKADEAMRFLAQEISMDTYVNIMDQYHPCFHSHERPALDAARKAGLKRTDRETI